ncbi:MAG: fatty acid--CoA ligase family protein [Novosphingobium sp.]|nr:fatty acid--CoA ligase family protein [Novosphingobium sp.]
MAISADLHDALAGWGDNAILEYQDRRCTPEDLARWRQEFRELLRDGGIADDAPVALIARNRLLHAVVMIACALEERSLANIYAIQSPESIAAELAALRPSVVIADAADWHPSIHDAAAALGAVGIVLDHAGPCTITAAPGIERTGAGPFREPPCEPGLEILSSGTTGPPKRILLPFRIMDRFIATAKAAGGPNAVASPEVVIMPFSGIGGASALLANVALRRTTVLLEKFSVGSWVRAVERHRPEYVTIPPAAIRMILDAQVDPGSLRSIRYVTGGGAKLEPALQDEFEACYGAKILWGYGATEFGGTLACWTPELRDRFHARKRGSVGRLLPSVHARIVDPATGKDLGIGAIGLIEALIPAVGPDWIRTTDLGLLDEEGFLFHHGRADGAIVRGGFKVMPERIVEAMRQHTGVRDVAVVAVPSRRLGQVPVAVIQPWPDQPQPSKTGLLAHARRHLVAHHVPANFYFVSELPRTLTMKIDQAAVAALVGKLAGADESGCHG